MQIILTESHRGTVSEVRIREVVITYETPTGPTKQVYRHEQFMEGTALRVGDAVIFRLHVLTHSPASRSR